MKVLSRIVIVFLILNGCVLPNEYERGDVALEKKIKSEIDSKIRYDTIYQGYRFGMSKLEFEKWSRKLDKEGKVTVLCRTCNKQTYVFDITTERYEYYAYLSPKFFENSLYRIGLYISIKDNSSIILKSDLLELYKSKYGDDFYTQKPSSDRVGDVVWVDGNRKIVIEERFTNAINVYYEDILTKIKIDNIERIEKEKKMSKERIEKEKNKSNTINEI